jgi:hypothetical protein
MGWIILVGVFFIVIVVTCILVYYRTNRKNSIHIDNH